ncbi:unnamed protein product [Symbiodinium sp. KB8]|nr:unnamed protein product [Symbiodinium sp. KB8]
MVDAEDEVTAGWLMKKGEGVLAGYKRRYVVLDNGVMSYYKSIDDYESGQPPLKGNRIKIQDYTCKAVATETSQFQLCPNSATAGGRVWDFKTSSKQTRDAWVEAFHNEGAQK